MFPNVGGYVLLIFAILALVQRLWAWRRFGRAITWVGALELAGLFLLLIVFFDFFASLSTIQRVSLSLIICGVLIANVGFAFARLLRSLDRSR